MSFWDLRRTRSGKFFSNPSTFYPLDFYAFSSRLCLSLFWIPLESKLSKMAF